MPKSAAKTLRKWLLVFMGAVVIASVAIWFMTRDTLPRVIRIATGEQGGLYYELGQTLAESLQARTGRRAEVVPTRGSVENYSLLKSGEAEIAILQGGSVSSKGLAVVAPLYAEILHLIVRREGDITNINNLSGRNVVLGPEESGMRHTAMKALAHYGLVDRIVDAREVYFMAMQTNAALEAAFVTTGILNRDLQQLFLSGNFRLIPIEDAHAMELKDAFLHRKTIPTGLYRENPPVPDRDIQTIATTAYLAIGGNPSKRLIEEVLSALYEEELPLRFPIMIPHTQAIETAPARLHPAARLYFNPPDHIGLLANVLESLAAVKELLFALAAASFLVWDRYRRLQEKERQQSIQAQKDYLDQYLEQTLAIEEAQMNTTEPDALKGYLDQVTRIKLKALKELTDEELRSDQAFSIFIMQCANLINKIQFKIISRAARREEPKRNPRSGSSLEN